jgi:magnesium transporter
VSPVPERMSRPVGHGPGAVEVSATFTGALYKDGKRIVTTTSVDDTIEALADNPGAMAWIGLYKPSAKVIQSVAAHFGVNRLLAEDMIKLNQRPRHERDGDIHFFVLHNARYVADQDILTNAFEFGEIHIISGPDFVVTIRHCDHPNLDGVRQRMEEEPELLRFGTRAVIYGVLDAIVDRYFPAADGLRSDIDELEDKVFDKGIDDPRPAYHLSRQTTFFSARLRSTEEILADLDGEFGEQHVPVELKSYFNDVADHLTRLRERSDMMQSTLRDVLSMNVSIIGMRRNDEMKKISAWAAILFTPSLITGIYGMNFDHMPELHWFFGYPMSLILMVGAALMLYVIFKKKDWI